RRSSPTRPQRPNPLAALFTAIVSPPPQDPQRHLPTGASDMRHAAVNEAAPARSETLAREAAENATKVAAPRRRTSRATTICFWSKHGDHDPADDDVEQDHGPR